VAQEPVQKELGLSSEQTAKLADLPKGEANQRGFRDMSEEERRQAMETRAKLVAEQDKALAGILDEKQSARLTQIKMQAVGARALLEEDVAKRMKITPEQTEKLQAGLQEIMQAARGGGGGPAQWRQQALEKVAEILTPEQKADFKALQGTEFDLSKLELGMGGRRGQ
jgi:Spy/CpxP family protein refolding chaperone